MKHSGMTLIEVLIASIVLFIAIAAGSMIARTQYLYQSRTESVIAKHYWFDSVKDNIVFELSYGGETDGIVPLSDKNLLWQASVIEKKPFAASLDNTSGDIANDRGFLTLYQIQVFEGTSDKMLFEYSTVLWSQS